MVEFSYEEVYGVVAQLVRFRDHQDRRIATERAARERLERDLADARATVEQWTTVARQLEERVRSLTPPAAEPDEGAKGKWGVWLPGEARWASFGGTPRIPRQWNTQGAAEVWAKEHLGGFDVRPLPPADKEGA